jgi:hypothetical protein
MNDMRKSQTTLRGVNRRRRFVVMSGLELIRVKGVKERKTRQRTQDKPTTTANQNSRCST